VATKFAKPVLVSVHPRTAERLAQSKQASTSRVRLLKAMGFFDFVKLEKNSLAVLTDSGTVQEECSIFGIPNVTIRDVTERPETIECGSNILSGADPNAILESVGLAIAQPAAWAPPREYLSENVSQTVTKILLGYSSIRRHIS
jgi:UDP-N-acetylglucosamine 2-epimerase (non-hydrolysing)